MAKRPNLLFVFADQMRAMDTGCGGNPAVLTPNLDSLSGQGMYFDTCVSTFPVCTPYRACLVSGKYPTSAGVLDNDVPLPITGTGFGHELKNAGYRTGWIGKWHLFGSEPLRKTFIPPGEHRHGFDTFIGVNCAHEYRSGFYYGSRSPEKIPFQGYEPDLQTDLALQFIEENQQEPFALFLSFGPPHDPYHEVPQAYKALYRPEDIVYRPNVQPDQPLYNDAPPGNNPRPWEADVYRMHRPYDPDETRWPYPHREVARDYYAAITALDANLGRLMRRLGELGLAEDTILVFTADHGDMLYSHRLVQKNYPYDESILVPFILRYPGAVRAASRLAAPFSTVDILPTLLELMGLPVPPYSEGVSFARAVRGEQQPLPECAYMLCSWDWAMPEWRGIRTARYTYVETPDGPYALFDNLTDPYQLENLAGRPGCAALQRQLQSLYRQQQRAVGDPFETWPVIRERMQRDRETFAHRYPELFMADRDSAAPD